MRGFGEKITRYLSTYFAYLQRSRRASYLPFFVGVETSGVCNLRCVMCPHSLPPKGRRGLMAFETFQSVVDEAKHFVLEADLFGGGEPLLHPKIFEMVRYASSNGMRTRIHTNATRLTHDVSLELLNSGLDFLSMSFDGHDKETYERQRVNADYDMTLHNIRSFLETKRELGLRKPHVVIQSVASDTSVHARAAREKRSLASAFAGLPVDEFRVIRQHNYGGKVGSSSRVGEAYTPCTFPWYAIYVLWDGTIVPCCLDWWGDYPLGNIASTSLKAAWFSENLIALRDTLATGKTERIPMCTDCDRLRQRSFFGIPASSARSVRDFIKI